MISDNTVTARFQRWTHRTWPLDVPEFDVRTLHGDRVWRVIRRHEDGSQRDVAEVAWSIELRHPSLTRERFERAMRGHVEVQPARTWSWQPEPGTFTAWLCHNGAPVGSVEWIPGMSRKEDRLRWMDAIADGMNQERGHGDPFPEPKPPLQAWDYIPGDHDHATGKDVAA